MTRSGIARAARRTLWIAGALLLAGGAAALEPGDRAPAFAAPSLAGDGNLSLADFRGKVVFLDFWASWCAPCLTSLPALDALRQQFPASDFQVLAVNVDKEPAKARAFLAKRPVGYPSATDPEGRIPESFEIETMPSSFLIDRSGVIRRVQRGFRPGELDALRAEISKLVGRPPVALR